ncbi:MAG TPA: DNA-directed RNA polymerase [Nanoarchaeota archaeon]|nr:DNA-directed RNA polymerase [Nanoarchaeota archaeon]
MFYEAQVRSHVRVPPKFFGEDTSEAILKSLNSQYDGFISKDLGVIIGVTEVKEVKEGIIIPGDGAAYYETVFNILAFKPELQEVVLGKIADITDFGAFITIGPIDGMIHVSQSMDDFVSFGKSNVLTGKDTKHTLKVGDLCRARVIAVSFKDISNPRIGLTMRQHRLGALSWIDEDLKKEKKGTSEEKAEKPKAEKKEKKEKK